MVFVETMIMASSLEDTYLHACKTGDLDTIRLVIDNNVDVNTLGGWGLRRAVRYNHPHVWQFLLEKTNVQVNLHNKFGLTALHTACRFNIPGAIFDLLRHRNIEVNLPSCQGSSPIMVAVKYCSKEALQIIIRDKRIDLNTTDKNNRKLEEVVGIAINDMRSEDKAEILDCLQNGRQWQVEEEGRRNSLEEENIDGIHREKIFKLAKIKEFYDELKELRVKDQTKVQREQEIESQRFMERMERDLVTFLEKQQEERTIYLSKIIQEKIDFDQRQQTELQRILKREEEEDFAIWRQPGSRQSETTSPRSFSQSRPSSRRPSLKTHMEIPNCETMSDSSGPSLWEWTVPDEGYCTGKDHELPEIIDSARKELECPICMEVMAPPSKIWQCKVGHVICEDCKERVKKQMSTNTSICTICKSVPIIGRNLALERISRSLFGTK